MKSICSDKGLWCNVGYECRVQELREYQLIYTENLSFQSYQLHRANDIRVRIKRG